MSVTQGCIDNMAVVEKFKEALEQRIGVDRFRMWFADDVTFQFCADSAAANTAAANLQVAKGRLIVAVKGQFALQRLRQHFVREMRAAAAQSIGHTVEVITELAASPAEQTELPLCGDTQEASGELPAPNVVPKAKPHSATSKHVSVVEREKSITTLVQRRTPKRAPRTMQRDDQAQPLLPNIDSQTQQAGDSEPNVKVVGNTIAQTLATFIGGDCNQLALTATQMVCDDPRAATPLFLSGPTGVGKSHLLAAIADQLRRRYRLRRVIRLSAESFANDFITSVNSSGLPAFRRRYRDVDALLIDDVQFLGSKRATLREMLYTVETLYDAGRPLIFTGSHSPHEIAGLTQELAGRLASGLVCPLQPLSPTIRQSLLLRTIEDRCAIAWPDATVSEVNAMLIGDGRVVQGVVNLVATLQRMYQRMPTMDEIRQHGGQLLRASKPAVTLLTIERAVAQTFHLPTETLRSHAKTRSVSEPRMLAMYLSRELTSAAYSEIGRHYGGRSHSTALVASQKVQAWLQSGKSVGRGAAAVSARDALERIEGILRSG